MKRIISITPDPGVMVLLALIDTLYDAFDEGQHPDEQEHFKTLLDCLENGFYLKLEDDGEFRLVATRHTRATIPEVAVALGIE